MRALRIVFMGTPDFAVETLKQIIANNHEVVGVITAPDRPAGRGRKLKASAVKEYAQSKHLKVLQPTNLKDETFLEELKALNANLNIVVAFRMLPKLVWDMPEYGTFNLHASLLPDYRGAAPINWAIINGEKKTGITTFFIDEKIDTGQIILQEEVAIEENDTAGTLHDKHSRHDIFHCFNYTMALVITNALVRQCRGVNIQRVTATGCPVNCATGLVMNIA